MLNRGVRLIRRLQLFVKTLCHHCSDEPSACPYVNSDIPGETETVGAPKFSFSNVFFSPCFVLIHTVTFPLWVIR